MGIVSRYFDKKKEEFTPTVFLFFYFFLITATVYVIKPVKISLFLEWLSFENLPWAYLLTAIFLGFFVTLNSRLLYAMNRQVYVALSLAFFIANLLCFWWLFKIHWKWLSLVFWFWTDIFAATSVTQFWILVNDTYHPRQAKKIIGFLVSGGLLGGVTGALAASFFARMIKTENLLLVCPIFLAVCLALVIFLWGSKKQAEKLKKKIAKINKRKKVGPMNAFRIFAGNRHLVYLGGIMASAIIVTTLIDFQFNYVIQQNFMNMDARTAFLGTFFTFLLAFSYMLHVLATNRILKNFGMRTALLITPVVLLTGSAALFFIPLASTYLVMFLKGADKSLAHSLSQSVRELLYIPVAPKVKYRAKMFIDMFVNKFSKAFAAILLLVFFTILNFSFSVQRVGIIVIFFIFIWIGLNWRITKEYIGIVKKNLKIKWQDADKFISEKIDVDMTKLVFDTLQNKNRSSVLYAMNLFDLIKNEKLSPELKRIIASKCDEIRASSMDSLLELDGESLLPEIDDAIRDKHLDTQIREIMSMDVYQELIKEQIDKILERKDEDADVSKMEAAKVIGMMGPAPSFIPQLIRLLRDDSVEVFRYAVESAGKLKQREFVPIIIDQLKKPAIKRIAGQALVNYGTKILGTLKDYLADSDEDIHTRKSIPDIMFRIGTQKAANMMVMEMKKRNADVEFELVEALYKLRVEDSNIRFPYQDIKPEILFLIEKSCLILLEMNDLMSDKKKANLVSELENNLGRSLKHIFESLSLIYPHKDIIKAYQNISSGTKRSIDYSCELLDNVLKKELKEYLFPLIDDISFDEKVKRCRNMLKDLEKS